MVAEKKWYRVIDPLNPLFGCDVLLSGRAVWNIEWAFDEDVKFYQVIAMRRVDVFVGDRPFQLVAKEGEDLGLMISSCCIASSPIQDETVELTTDRPYGLCIDESEMTRRDGYTLRVARYEQATQVALSDPQEELLATKTFAAMPGREGIGYTPDETVIAMFECGNDPDEIVAILKGRD